MSVLAWAKGAARIIAAAGMPKAATGIAGKTGRFMFLHSSRGRAQFTGCRFSNGRVARRLGRRRRAHRSDGVGLVARRVTAAIGSDMHVVVVVGGFVAEVRRPAWLADPGVDLLPPDHVVVPPPFGVSQCITGYLVAEFDAFRRVVVRDHHVNRQPVGMPPQGVL